MIHDYRPLKSDPDWVRLKVSGDMSEYPNDATLSAASLLEKTLLLNSTISDASERAYFLTLDIEYVFLQMYMKQPEYMMIHS